MKERARGQEAGMEREIERGGEDGEHRASFLCSTLPATLGSSSVASELESPGARGKMVRGRDIGGGLPKVRLGFLSSYG